MQHKFGILLLLFSLCFATNGFSQLNKSYFFNRARIQLGNDQNTEAIATINHLLKADTTIAEAWMLRGVAKYSLNDLRGSIADLSAAIRINPVYTLAYLYRGSAYSQIGRTDVAISDYNMVIDLRPSSTDAYFNRGIAYLLRQNFKKSESDFSKVIALDPKNADAWINRGTARLYNADTLGALADYNRAVNLKPFYSEAYGKRGRIYFERKKYLLALADFNKSVELDSLGSMYFFFRALTYNELNNFPKALDDFNRTINLNPSNPLSLFNRALVYWKLNDTQNALADFNRANELNPNNLLIHFNRAVLQLEIKRYQNAITDLTKAIELFPDFYRAYLARSEAYQQIGNKSKAQSDYLFARSIAEKFSNDKSSPWTDTTSNFKALLAFSSDFSMPVGNPLLSDIESKAPDIMPFLRVVAVSKQSVKYSTQSNPFTDSLNKSINDEEFTFTTSVQNTNTIQTWEYSGSSSLVRILLNLQQLSSASKYRETIEGYQNALANDPKNPALLLNLAAEKADMASFIAMFEDEVKPLVVGSQIGSNKTQKSQTITPVALEEPLEILMYLDNLLPNSEVLAYNIGNIHALTGENAKAIEAYTKAIAINPSVPQPWFNRGFIYLMEKNSENACTDLGKAGELGLRQAYLLIHKFCKK